MINDITVLVISICTAIFEVLIINTFLAEFLNRERPFITLKSKICSLIYILIIIFVNLKSNNSSVTICINLTLAFTYSFIYSKKVMLNIFAALIVIAILMVSEVLAFFLITSLASVSPEIALTDNSLFILGVSIAKIIAFMGLKIIALFRKRSYNSLPKGYFVALITVPIISMLSIVFIVLTTDYNLSHTMMYLAEIVVAGNLYSNFIILYLFDSIIEKSEIKTKNARLSTQLSLQAEHYKELELSNREVRKLRHDMKNHLICLKEYISSGNNEEAMNYISSVSGLMSHSANNIDTGNSTLDAILFHKKAYAQSKNIKVNYDIQIPQGLKLDGADCCILLGNALDNAIEANEKLENEILRYIDCRILYQKNSFICNIKNPTSENVIIKNNSIATTKQNKKEHGIGLENIKQIVEKYNGTFNINFENNVFELTFMLLIN